MIVVNGCVGVVLGIVGGSDFRACLGAIVSREIIVGFFRPSAIVSLP